MNRGVLSGLKSIFIPEWAGGGDPANDGALLGFDSTQPGGIKPTQGGLTGRLLAVTGYAAGADGATYTIAAGGAFADVDAANLVLPSVTAPASGRLFVAVTADVAIVSGGGNGFFCLREGSTTIGGQIVTSLNGLLCSQACGFLITGLTPGSGHVYKLGAKSLTSSLGIYTGPTYGSVTMAAYEA